MATREADNKNYLSAIEFSFKFLSYELNTSIDNYIKEFKKSEPVPKNISSTLMQISSLYEDSKEYEKAIEYYYTI